MVLSQDHLLPQNNDHQAKNYTCPFQRLVDCILGVDYGCAVTYPFPPSSKLIYKQQKPFHPTFKGRKRVITAPWYHLRLQVSKLVRSFIDNGQNYRRTSTINVRRRYSKGDLPNLFPRKLSAVISLSLRKLRLYSSLSSYFSYLYKLYYQYFPANANFIMEEASDNKFLTEKVKENAKN